MSHGSNIRKPYYKVAEIAKCGVRKARHLLILCVEFKLRAF